MKKLFTVATALAVTLGVSAQFATESSTAVIFDAAEDTTQVTTISDIIDVQETVSTNNVSDAHFRKVWGRNSFFNLGYLASSSMKPNQKQPIFTGLNQEETISQFDSDWGAFLTLGHNYKLHKNAIANVVRINLDWNYLNLTCKHFAAAKGDAIYNYNEKFYIKDEDGDFSAFHYVPWNYEKYNVDYTMSIGPSLTLAPFTYIHVPGLHFLKFNIYYHVGYGVDLMLINTNKKFDLAYKNRPNDYSYQYIDGIKVLWGHGINTTFGVSMSWKGIGVGWETKNEKIAYKSLGDEYLFGNLTYKFKASNSRLYIQIRY